MATPKDIERSYILEVDIAGESFVLGIRGVKDSLKVFNILGDNGYNVTLEAVTKIKEKTDEEVPDVRR